MTAPSAGIGTVRSRSAGSTGSTATWGAPVRAYAYVFLHGADGLEEVSELAALNANYLAALSAPEFPRAYPDMPPMHEFVATAAPLEKETGIRVMDVAKRVIDLGYHPSTVYFPLVVDEAMMVEPTETESKETLDGLAAAFLQAAAESRTAPRSAPCRPGDHARPAAGRSQGGTPAEAHLGRRAP